MLNELYYYYDITLNDENDNDDNHDRICNNKARKLFKMHFNLYFNIFVNVFKMY